MKVLAKDIINFCEAHICTDEDCPLSKNSECKLRNVPAYWDEYDLNKIAEWVKNH